MIDKYSVSIELENNVNIQLVIKTSKFNLIFDKNLFNLGNFSNSNKFIFSNFFFKN